MKRRVAVESGYAVPFARLMEKRATEIANIPGGECLEFVSGGLFVAYNPHRTRTYTTRGQWLDPGTVYVADDKTGEGLVLMERDGGKTLSGGTTGPRYGQLMSLFSALPIAILLFAISCANPIPGAATDRVAECRPDDALYVLRCVDDCCYRVDCYDHRLFMHDGHLWSCVWDCPGGTRRMDFDDVSGCLEIVGHFDGCNDP